MLLTLRLLVLTLCALCVISLEIDRVTFFDKYGQVAQMLTEESTISLQIQNDDDCEQIQPSGDINDYQLVIFDELGAWPYASKDCRDSSFGFPPTWHLPLLDYKTYRLGLATLRGNNRRNVSKNTFAVNYAFHGDNHEKCLSMDLECDTNEGPWYFIQKKDSDRMYCSKLANEDQIVRRDVGASYEKFNVENLGHTADHPRYRYCPVNKEGLLESIAANYAQTVGHWTNAACPGAGQPIPRFEHRGRVVSFREPIPVITAADESLKLFCPGAKFTYCVFYLENADLIFASDFSGHFVKDCSNGSTMRRPTDREGNIYGWRVIRLVCTIHPHHNDTTHNDDVRLEVHLVVFGNITVKRDTSTNVSDCRPDSRIKAPFKLEAYWWTHPEDKETHLGSRNMLPRDDYACHAKVSAKLCVPYWRYETEISSIEATKHAATNPVSQSAATIHPVSQSVTTPAGSNKTETPCATCAPCGSNGASAKMCENQYPVAMFMAILHVAMFGRS